MCVHYKPRLHINCTNVITENKANQRNRENKQKSKANVKKTKIKFSSELTKRKISLNAPTHQMPE